jgi:L-asparaginase / beta-aspartyl-peptidase
MKITTTTRAIAVAIMAAALVASGACAPPPGRAATPSPATPSPAAAPAPAANPGSTAMPSPSGRTAAPAYAPPAGASPTIRWGLVIHGGAGTITPEQMTPEREAEYRSALEASLRAGYHVLAAGGSALDAVVAATRVMEDSPLFNAGRGAVFTAEGRNELDASIMDGATLDAGAVAGVLHVRNPIELARRVMEASPHVMLAGDGAEAFARTQEIELVDPSYFHTDHRWEALQRARAAEERRQSLGDKPAAAAPYGTVGVVALARDGTLAAGTSTGGMTNKRWGRIGDAPIIGAGTYADDECGVSATGWGEYFIRNVVAYDICARKRYRGSSLEEAAREVIWDRLEAQQPETGGIISLDREGHVVMMFNSRGMYRGYIDQDGRVVTAIFR